MRENYRKCKPETKPQPKKEDSDDTSRYIALFRDGLIGKEEFFKLTTNTNNNQNEPSLIYQWLLHNSLELWWNRREQVLMGVLTY